MDIKEGHIKDQSCYNFYSYLKANESIVHKIHEGKNGNFLYIPFNVPSSKNSKRIVQIPVKGKKGVKRPMLINSKLVEQYKKNTDSIYEGYKFPFRDLEGFLPKPMDVTFFFVRKDRRAFDFNNASQIVQDLMVKYDWIDDDDSRTMYPVFGGFVVDKEMAGVVIKIEKVEPSSFESNNQH